MLTRKALRQAQVGVSRAGNQQLAVRTEAKPSKPEIALLRPRQANQLPVVVQPAHDHRARFLHDRVPFQGGIDADTEDVAAVVLPALAEVGQTKGRDGKVADLGQPLPALGVSAQDLCGLGEPVQAVEPLANQPRALEGGSLGDQRLAQGEPGPMLGLLGVAEPLGRSPFGLQGPIQVPLGLFLLDVQLVELVAVCPRRDGRANG
jgi:hypothetical protein